VPGTWFSSISNDENFWSAALALPQTKACTPDSLFSENPVKVKPQFFWGKNRIGGKGKHPSAIEP
jgi:hypothetical protein